MACASDRADQQHRARQGETPGHHPERGAGTGQARERRGENGAERDRPRTERAHGRGEPAEERWRAVLLAEAPDEDVSDAKAGTHRERAGRDEDDPPSGLCERDQEPEGHAREHGGHERPGGSEPPGDAGGSGGARQPADASDPDHGPGDARGEVQGANEEGDLQGLPPGEAEVRHSPERHEHPQVRVGSHEAEPRRDLLDEPRCLDARPGLSPARGERVEAGNGEAEAHRGQATAPIAPESWATTPARPGPTTFAPARPAWSAPFASSSSRRSTTVVMTRFDAVRENTAPVPATTATASSWATPSTPSDAATGRLPSASRPPRSLATMTVRGSQRSIQAPAGRPTARKGIQAAA